MSEETKAIIWNWLRIAQVIIILGMPPAGYLFTLQVGNMIDSRLKSFKGELKSEFITQLDASEFAMDDQLTNFKTKTNAAVDANRSLIQLVEARSDAQIESLRAELVGIRSDVADIKDDVRTLIGLQMQSKQ